MKSLGDLNWRLAPIVSALNAIGGWNFTWIRRLGVPFSVILFTFLYYNVKKKYYLFLYPILALTVGLVFRMPLTLISDSVQGHWQNWVWICIFGAVQGFGLLPLAFFGKPKVDRWLGGLVIHNSVACLLLTLSNTWGYPTHAWVEAGIGMSFGGFAAWLIDET